jgi:hypothetical protein
MPISQEKSSDILTYAKRLRPVSAQEKRVVPLPTVKLDHMTPLPGIPSFLVLTTSFCFFVKKQISHLGGSTGFDLATPVGRLHVEGNTEIENGFLQNYVMCELAPAGLKGLVVLIDVYRMLSLKRDQSQSIDVTVKQLLQRMGKGEHASDRHEQAYLLNTILYLSRTTVTSISSQQVHSAPLLVLENMQADKRGNIWLSYHLSVEFFNAIYGHESHMFLLPTSHVVKYHSSQDYHTLLLTFFLGNRLVQGACSLYFVTLCIESGLLSYEQILPGEKNRLRNVQSVIFALLELESDGFIYLESHPDLDLIYAVNYLEETSDRREKLYSHIILQRLEAHILALQGLSKSNLKAQRRKALQHLLIVDTTYEDRAEEFPEWGTRITIHPSTLFLEKQDKLSSNVSRQFQARS